MNFNCETAVYALSFGFGMSSMALNFSIFKVQLD